MWERLLYQSAENIYSDWLVCWTRVCIGNNVAVDFSAYPDSYDDAHSVAVYISLDDSGFLTLDGHVAGQKWNIITLCNYGVISTSGSNWQQI